MKAGTGLKSVACDTEVMVIRARDAVVACDGRPMADERPPQRAAIDPASTAGTRMGRRHVDAAGKLELLCVKPGQGSLSVVGVALRTKDAKPLPSSD